MSTQPPSDDTHAKGVPQYHLAPCTRRGFTPQKTRNEPKKTTPDAIGPLLYLTPVFQPGILPQLKKCETNPISAHQVSRQPRFLRNEPNLALAPHYSPFTARHSLFYENEPNFHIPSVPPPPNYAKRTQFPNANRQKMRNEPNPNLPRCPKGSPDASGNPISGVTDKIWNIRRGGLRTND